MQVRVLILDDDERERIVLRYILEQIKDVEIVAEAKNGIEALSFCQSKEIDLIILNINSVEINGLETARKIKHLKDAPLIVFSTTSKDKAVEAFEIGALDYIVKPLEQARIEKTIEKAKMQLLHLDIIDSIVKDKLKERIDFILKTFKDSDVFSKRLPIRERGKISLINFDEIVYCESQGKKVYIATREKGFLSSYTLNELEHRLDKDVFFRAHQAFLVNVNYICEIISLGEGSYQLKINLSDKQIILSRAKAKMLRIKLGI